MQNTKSIDNSKYYYNPYNRSKIFPKRKYPINISNPIFPTCTLSFKKM